LKKPFSNQEESKMLLSFKTGTQIQLSESCSGLTEEGEAWLVVFEKDCNGFPVLMNGFPVVKEIRAVFFNGLLKTDSLQELPPVSLEDRQAETLVAA
jgi:hypothetical protein